MTQLLATDHSNIPVWPTWVYVVFFIGVLVWAAVVERRRDIRRKRHIHYFSDAEGACQTPGCTALRRDRRSNA